MYVVRKELTRINQVLSPEYEGNVLVQTMCFAPVINRELF